MDGWEYVKQHKRLATAEVEPYLGIDMHCDPDINEKPNGFAGYKVVDWERVSPSGGYGIQLEFCFSDNSNVA